MWLFSNPTLGVVIFRLCGLCMLGAFLLPAFTCLGHERQDLLSPCDGMHRLHFGLYCHLKEFGGSGVRTYVNSKVKNPLYWNSPWRRRIKSMTLHQAGQASPTHYQRAVSAPPPFFFYPSIEVVTFHLHGLCMLDVLLSAFTCLGHECWDLLSLCDGMHASTDYTSVYTVIQRSLGGNGVRTHVDSKGKIRSAGKILPRGGLNPRCCIKQDSQPNTLPMSYSSPRPKSWMRT